MLQAAHLSAPMGRQWKRALPYWGEPIFSQKIIKTVKNIKLSLFIFYVADKENVLMTKND